MRRLHRHVGFVPLPDSCTAVSFDHLVGAQQDGLRDGDAQRLCDPHVDHLSLSETLSGWRLTENRAMLLFNDRRREQYMPLVAFCLRHFSADFIICTCEFEFRQAQQSSRRLERECQRNIELVWLTGRLMPLRADIVEKRSAVNGPMRHERPSASRKRGAGNLRAPVQRERPVLCGQCSERPHFTRGQPPSLSGRKA
jgi:hypothetical protein